MNEDDTPVTADIDASPADAEDQTPDVDELEDRLRDMQNAMDQLQSGDLDAAERSIESLETRIGSPRD